MHGEVFRIRPVVPGVLAATFAATLIVLAGCGGDPAGFTAPDSAGSHSPAAPVSSWASAPAPALPPSVVSEVPAPPVALPPAGEPVAGIAGDCPYLSAMDVAQINGQMVGQVQIDPTFAPPACFFSDGSGTQVSTWVYLAPSPAQAVAAVELAAPTASTQLASEPAGWSGGRFGGPDGSVYAVYRGSVAVVVRSNQAQSVKAQRLAEMVIGALAL